MVDLQIGIMEFWTKIQEQKSRGKKIMNSLYLSKYEIALSISYVIIIYLFYIAYYINLINCQIEYIVQNFHKKCNLNLLKSDN